MKVSLRLSVLVLAWLGLGCATSVKVVFDEGHDFSSYRTWEWLPGYARQVEAPHGDPNVLEKRLERLVERAMGARGIERSTADPHLLVSVYLGVQRQLVYVNETGALQTLHSLHDSPSFEVQTTKQAIHSYEKGYVVITLVDASEVKRVWRGEFQGLYRGVFWPHLDDAVSTLFERIPDGAPLSPAGI